jgi:hypothetical protein
MAGLGPRRFRSPVPIEILPMSKRYRAATGVWRWLYGGVAQKRILFGQVQLAEQAGSPLWGVAQISG